MCYTIKITVIMSSMLLYLLIYTYIFLLCELLRNFSSSMFEVSSYTLQDPIHISIEIWKNKILKIPNSFAHDTQTHIAICQDTMEEQTTPRAIDKPRAAYVDYKST